MSNDTIVFFLSVIIVILLTVIIYQRIEFRRGTQEKLKQISQNLAEILNTDSDRKVMVFTNNKMLIDLLGQINRLLLDRQHITANFRHSEISAKKMLSNISHDIKTPMTVILGYLEIMRLHSPEDITLIKVEKKGKQVMDLINQFFTLAKLEAGDTNIIISKVNINEVCREAVLDFYEILTKNDFQVDIEIPEEKFFVQGNVDALNRILFNLISNAVRYGSDGKYLGVVLYVKDSMAYIDVIDHGKGIERDFAVNVFERLYTMEDSRNRKIQGNGLGLTISKNLAMQMGGDIYLESIPNRKTIFTLQIKRFIR